MATEIKLPEGRIVSGHPMERNLVKDKHGQPALDKSGQQQFEVYFGIAIPKNGTTDWKQTAWGQTLHAAAVAEWPNQQYNMRDFSWKVTDGDSTEMNKKGKRPCDQEGWPGHWVIHASTRLPSGVRCYHIGKYDAMQQIQNPNEIKRGDYGRLLITVKANGSSESPGMYVNPEMFSLDRAGEIILGAQRDANDVFGSGAPSAAPSMPASTPAPAPAPMGAMMPAPAPAPDFLQPPVEVKRLASNGVAYTEAQLRAAGYTDAAIQALPVA